MKRRAFKLLFFLVAGAMINVAVAWVLSATYDRKGAIHGVVDGGSSDGRYGNGAAYITGSTRASLYAIVFFNSYEGPWQFGSDLAQVLPSWVERYLDDQVIAELRAQRLAQVVQASGWPTYSLSGGCLNRTLPPIGNTPIRTRGAIVLSAAPTRGWFNTPTLLPLHPIWPGFAINTIFYAAVLWVLSAVPVRVRRWRRIKRGQCASCGYSLRGSSESDKCPECGRSAPSPAERERAGVRVR